jgi:integrase
VGGATISEGIGAARWPLRLNPRDVEDELKTKHFSGTLGSIKADRDTVGAFLTDWLAIAADTVEASTHKTYTWIVRSHLVPGLGKIRLAKLTPKDVQSLYAAKLRAGLSAQSVHHCHAILRCALGQAVKWGHVAVNVCDRVDQPKLPHREMKVPVPADLGNLIDTSEESGDPLVALWAIATYSGCRKSELLGLQWADLDLEGGTLTVHRTLRGSKGGVPTYGKPKSVQSRRTVSLGDGAVAILRAHHDRQAFDRQRLGDAGPDYGLVFASSVGTQLDKGNVTRRFKRALKAAGLPESIRFHDLRHASATAMVRAGVHAKTVSARLGHSQIGITMDLYAHAMREADTDAAEKLGEVIPRRARQGTP